MLLDEKIILITGSSGGIGISIAKNLLKEGAYVILSDYRTDFFDKSIPELKKINDHFDIIEIDVTSIESIENGFKYIVELYRKIDVVINNAGICKIRPALEITPDEWDQVLDINLKGLFFCSQIAAKYMRNIGKGSIINIASNAGKTGFLDQADYNAAKAGVINLTRNLAEEWAQYGINVNAVCPGAVRTKMLTDIAELIASKSNQDPEFLLQSFAPRQLRRLILPDEVAKVVVFLSSDNASIIRGQAINIDGGSTPY